MVACWPAVVVNSLWITKLLLSWIFAIHQWDRMCLYKKHGENRRKWLMEPYLDRQERNCCHVLIRRKLTISSLIVPDQHLPEYTAAWCWLFTATLYHSAPSYIPLHWAHFYTCLLHPRVTFDSMTKTLVQFLTYASYV